MSIPTFDWYDEDCRKKTKNKHKTKRSNKTKINRDKQNPKLRVGTLSFDRLFLY